MPGPIEPALLTKVETSTVIYKVILHQKIKNDGDPDFSAKIAGMQEAYKGRTSYVLLAEDL
jgi:hypothetical protein